MTLKSRVLDIGDLSINSDQVKLVEPDNQCGRYASLSHCWGSSRHFLTTRDTMEELKCGIKISELPQTFQDAIFIAREVGLRYIWIDSLCICQDDKEDWEREAANMASIYSNATITISARCASNDSIGFLNARPKRKYVSLPYISNGTAGHVLAFDIPIGHAARGHRYVDAADEPLSERAWALQERYLSQRILHFDTSQVVFECKHHYITEDGYKHPWKLDWFNTTDTGILGHPHFYYRGIKSWANIVFHYSSLKLTRPSDKLPALAGLARKFAEARASTGHAETQYVAGLWRDNMIEGLSWQCIGGRGSYPAEYRAPSWSWAAIDGDVSITALGNWHNVATVESVHVDVQGQNPYGEVAGGWIRLKAILVRLTKSWVRSPDADKIPLKRNIRLKVEGGDSFGYYSGFDVKESIDQDRIDEMDLYMLPLAYRDETESGKTAFSLIVQPHKRDSLDTEVCFRRMGFIFISDLDVIDSWTSKPADVKFQSITLI